MLSSLPILLDHFLTPSVRLLVTQMRYGSDPVQGVSEIEARPSQGKADLPPVLEGPQ